jgi:hypothetical protein
MDSNTSAASEYLRLRLLVGRLGEKTCHRWWATEFFSASSPQFLVHAFPRSVLLAQYHGVTEAARRVHDEHIGVGRAFHLFRLPEEMEQDLHRLLLAGSESLSSLPLFDSAAAEAELARLAHGECVALPGPVALEGIGQLRSESSIRNMARTYLSAFRTGTRSYPYFPASA